MIPYFSIRCGLVSMKLPRLIEKLQELQVSYWKDGTLNNHAYAQLCHLLRDFRVNQSMNIDVALLDLLYTIQTLLSKERIYKPFMVLSAYRTKTTNDRLKGAARNSMHLYGKAIDIFIPGVRTEYLASLGHRLRCGGVGTYLHRGFIHLDTGRIRYWGVSSSSILQGHTSPLDLKGVDPVADFNPRDEKWKNASRDKLDAMIQKWRQRHRKRWLYRVKKQKTRGRLDYYE
jgi:uncharacterized protein YcbK (DUF882 family)